MIILDGQILKIETVGGDKSVKIIVSTQEISAAKMGELWPIIHQHVYFAIKPEPFLKTEIAAVESLKADLDDAKIKSPSRRLRDVLHVLWTQNNDGIKDFELFYVTRLDRIIQQIKDKLTP